MVSLFSDSIQQASWRGVPFAVELEQGSYGRRLAEHEYPFRDGEWPEDMGKRARRFRIQGFLIGNSLIYGGGDLQDQRAALESAAEQKGVGILVHPAKGAISVTLLDLTISTRADDGNIAELAFTFVQGTTQIFPSVLGELSALVGGAAGLCNAVGLGAFSTAVLGPLQSGLSAAASIGASASEWLGKINTLAGDATSLYGTVSQLGGADFGRFFNGRNSGFLSGLSSVYSSASSITDLLSLGAANRAAVTSAGKVLTAAISGLGGGSSPASVASSAQSVISALQASVADPADGVRIFADLASFAPLQPAAKQTAGAAFSDLMQQATAAAVAQVSATYAPSSADDALAVRNTVLAPIQAVIDKAGDTGADDVYQAFRGLRAAVTQDLGARGGDLAQLATLALPQALPAVLLAQSQYADPSRADELVTQADPIHPWFMPLSFKALAN